MVAAPDGRRRRTPRGSALAAGTAGTDRGDCLQSRHPLRFGWLGVGEAHRLLLGIHHRAGDAFAAGAGGGNSFRAVVGARVGRAAGCCRHRCLPLAAGPQRRSCARTGGVVGVSAHGHRRLGLAAAGGPLAAELAGRSQRLGKARFPRPPPPRPLAGNHRQRPGGDRGEAAGRRAGARCGRLRAHGGSIASLSPPPPAGPSRGVAFDRRPGCRCRGAGRAGARDGPGRRGFISRGLVALARADDLAACPGPRQRRPGDAGEIPRRKCFRGEPADPGHPR